MGPGLQDVVAAHQVVAVQVRAGAGHAQGTVVAAAGQPAEVDGEGERPQGLGGRRGADRRDRGIGVAAGVPPARRRRGPRPAHPARDRRAGLAAPRVQQLRGGERRHRRGQVQPVGQWPAQPRAVRPDRLLVARTGGPAAAAARVGGGDELDARGVGDRRPRPGHPHHALLQRLAEGVEHGAGPLVQLVEEQDPAVGQRQLARAGDTGAAAQERGRADAGVRGAERGPVVDERGGRRLQPPPRDGPDGGELQGLVARQRREDRGEAPGEHRLAAPRRAEEQQVVPPAAAISRARRASACPRTSARSGAASAAAGAAWAATGRGRASPRRTATASARSRTPATSRPPTRAASAALGSGTSRRATPCGGRDAAAGRTPGTARNRPSRDSSPSSTVERSASSPTAPSAARTATAMARSKRAPTLDTSAGAIVT